MIFCRAHQRKHAKPCFIQRYRRKMRARRSSRRREVKTR